MYAMLEAIVRLDAQLGNIPYITSGQGKRKADMEGGRRSGCPWSKSLYVFPCSLSVFYAFIDFSCVYGFPFVLYLCLSVGFMLFLCLFRLRYNVILDGQGEV